MKPLIKVYGKAMNRTALGIVNAYIKLKPKTTYSDLKKAFPDSLYEEIEGGYFNTIKPLGIFQSKEIVEGLPGKNLQQCHFMKDDEAIQLSDGTIIYVTNSWGRAALDRLINHAEQYGIVVAEASEAESFKRGEYRLEMLEEEKPKMSTAKKAVAAVATVGVLGAGTFGIMQKCSSDAVDVVKDKVVEKVKDEAKGQAEDYVKEKAENLMSGDTEIEISFSINQTKDNGKSWDVRDGLPDPEVIVEIDGVEMAKIEKIDDILNYQKSVSIDISDNSSVISFIVNDHDPVNTDKIGTGMFQIIKEIEPNKSYPVTANGSLKEFSIIFRK